MKKIMSNDSYEKTSIEYQLIECINNEPLIFVEKPINLISKKLHINTSTLTRTVRKLGFKNYKIFRNFIIEKVTEYKEYLIANNTIQSTKNMLNDSILTSNLNIKKTLDNILNNEMFEKVIDKIIGAKRVLLFGFGFNYFICQQLAKYFQVYNINGYNILNFYDALELVNASLDDLWIVISISLTTRETVFLLNELTLLNKNHVILITSNIKSEILKEISYVFKLEPVKYIQKSKIPDSFDLSINIVLITLVNLIIIAVINKINNDKLKRFLEFNAKTNKWKNRKTKPKKY